MATLGNMWGEKNKFQQDTKDLSEDDYNEVFFRIMNHAMLLQDQADK